MKKNVFKRVFKTTLAFLLIFGMLGQMLPTSDLQASEKEYHASSIEKLEGMEIDYTQFLDDSVMFQLPEGVGDDEEISVIITVDVVTIMDAYEGTDKTMSFTEYALESEDAAVIEEKISTRKAEILAELDELGIEYSLGDDYSTLLSGFEILIKAGDFAKTCVILDKGENAVVSEVYEVAKTDVVENDVTVYETGIFDTSGIKYDGSGLVVAVLDTGLDSNHSAFSVDNFTSTKLGLTYDQVAAVVGDTVASELVAGLTVDDVYINEKVPFGFDYADKDADVYSTHNNHGTHVSGVIVGKDDTITGVAPNAQLVSMKIFSDVVDTAMSSWILSALEDCVILGVDVINMSLGTACGFSRESDEEVLNGVYDKIRAAGISMVVAASNSYSSAYGSEANGNLGLTSNPDTGTVGSPSTYEGAFSIASISGVKTPYLTYNGEIIYYIETNDGTTEENVFLDELLGDEDSKTLEYVTIPGVGRSADYTGIDVTGKIVLVRRGSNTFEEKAIIAQQQGAAGIIIYNNVSGDIKMNVGDATLPSCSISQDDGEMLAAKGSGKITIDRKQVSGPFISDFSSWGPTPDLQIKPEITGHGGSILSAVTGGGYERLSGTSMACPNLAGVVLLMKQYVIENFPEIAKDDVQTTAFVYSLLMSTADIAMNKNGAPYAVRKQGAGLANIQSAMDTPAYITTKDSEGNVMDKTKIELGDDPDKTGVYELTFTINNFGDKKLTYTVGAYVMTEGVSETLTNAGETTVTEEAYILDGAKIEIVSVDGGTVKKNNVTVKAGEEAEVTVKITLSDSDKEYMDKSFENGMYVEGFVTLEAKKGTKIDLNVPYLAYYGDWTKAPLFDLTYYETNKEELDDGIDDEDKLKPDAYATRLIGGISEDYVSYLGTYYFMQDPSDMVIAANEDMIALSNQEGTIHSLRFMWTGLLRNAERIEIKIINDTTGEVVYETVDTDVRKSYGDGGSIYPANVDIDFDTMDYNFANNTEFTVSVTGYVDYRDGGLDTNTKNVYEFPLYIDFEAPTVSDVEYYYEYDSNLKKNRLYADVAIYDNHYSMAAQLGYVGMGTDENDNPTPAIQLFEQYLTPIYSERNGTTVVTFELTDYIYDIKDEAINENSFVLTVYDYSLNYATYEIGLPDNYTDFYFEGLEEGLTLSPNEVYSLEPIVTPSSEWAELLEFASSKTSVVNIVNNKLVAVRSGKAVIRVTDPTTNKSMTFDVTVLKEGDEGYVEYDKPVADVFSLDGFYTVKAYYMVSSGDKKLGDSGSSNYFEGNYNLSMYPSEAVTLLYTLDSYYPKDTTVEIESSNDSIVSVGNTGIITAVSEGYASVTINVLLDGESTYYSETISVEVKNPYVTTGSTLTHYYGNGGLVTIPSDLKLTTIGSFAFSNFDYIAKTEEELAQDDRETTKQWYLGDSTITKVVIPEGVTKIDAYAFANLVALEEVVLPSTLESIEYGAFQNCTSLSKITFSGENNVFIISQNAFENCALKGTIEFPNLCVISDYAFAGNTKLEGIVLSDRILSIGHYAFAGCKKLSDVTIGAAKVKYGTYAFTGCESLSEFYVNASVLPEGMFYQCDSMTKVTIGKDVNEIGEFAFRETMISEFVVESGNKAFEEQTADYVISANGNKLIAVSPMLTGEFTSANIGGNEVTEVADGAFSHNEEITSIVLPSVTKLGEYAFASNDELLTVTLGELTHIGDYAFFETSITEVPTFTEDTKLGKYAFAYTKITSVNVPDNVELPEGIFSQCLELQSVVIGNDVTIGNYAFATDKDECFEAKSYDEDGERYFYYEFATNLTSLTIGNNAVIGENAFAYAASLETVTLGENAEIGNMAFYNATSLKEIDLSKVTSIGEYAFSGDVYYICYDDSMVYAAVSKEGQYMYTYHAPALTNVNLSAATEIGAHAFSYCRDLTDVTLGAEITEIPEYAFAGCISLSNVNLAAIETVGQYAFMECALVNVDLSAATLVDKYAFVSNQALTTVTLNAEGTDAEEGAFAYCTILNTVNNLAASENIGAYAYAYTALNVIDITGAVNIGDQAFLKEEYTPVTIILGENLESLGDNPFALCVVEPFSTVVTEEVDDKEVTSTVYTFDITDTVKVVDGSLYSKVPFGWELIIYAGEEVVDVKVFEDTVRISSFAFAGTDVQMVTMPYTTTAIGHKAFYDCDSLNIVVFGSYNVPIMEEEFDPTYYETFDHIPGSGDYGTYTDYSGNEVQINGNGMIPFFMWNVTGGLYSNVFYGANFVDYVGYVQDKLTMVRPINGKNYDSFIMNQYFDLTIDGPAAPDDVTVAAINAIKAIPERVTYEHKSLVEAARAAYNKIATNEQLALVSNYSVLVSAEQRVAALAPTDDNTAAVVTPKSNVGLIILIVILAVLLVAAVLGVIFRKQITEFWNKEETIEARKAFVEKMKALWMTIRGAVNKTVNKALIACKNFFGKLSKKKENAEEEESTSEEGSVEEAVEAQEVEKNETEN